MNCFRTGDISILQVDAIVNPTNETMDDNSPMCQRIFSRAGSALKIEIYNEVKGTIIVAHYLYTCNDGIYFNTLLVKMLQNAELAK